MRLPYYAFKPGAVRDATSLAVVEGTKTYPAEGSISYTTVSLNQVTLLEAAVGWLDDDIDIHPEEEVLGDHDAKENREINLQMMDTSQQIATQVALEELGYEVPVHIGGEMILRIIEGSPAEAVLHEGDTIVAIDGERLDELGDLDRLLSAKAPGDPLTLRIKPFTESAEKDVSLILAQHEDDPNRAFIGIQREPTGVEFDFPIDVTFDTGKVGGPSAGLAFTLGLIDALTPGELTGGESVAVTGTIASDGSVGPIGGAAQKAAAVRQAGVDVFLVPSEDYAEAKRRAGDVKVVMVDTLDDALAAMAELGGNGLALPRLGDAPADAA